MTKKTININMKATEDDREYLRTKAAKARLSQSEFLRRLIYDYSDQLIAKERQVEVISKTKE
jgi:uncharacterized protein (DUF1778 family)